MKGLSWFLCTLFQMRHDRALHIQWRYRFSLPIYQIVDLSFVTSCCSFPCNINFQRINPGCVGKNSTKKKTKNKKLWVPRWWRTKTHCCGRKCFPVFPRAQHLCPTKDMFLISFKNILCPRQSFPNKHKQKRALVCHSLKGFMTHLFGSARSIHNDVNICGYVMRK